jgi:hypothetical protein
MNNIYIRGACFTQYMFVWESGELVPVGTFLGGAGSLFYTICACLGIRGACFFDCG